MGSRESRAETWPNIASPFLRHSTGSKMAKVSFGWRKRSETDRRGDFAEIDPETGFLARVSFSKDRRSRVLMYRESENSREKRKEKGVERSASFG